MSKTVIGICYTCGSPVHQGYGYLQRTRGKWRVFHNDRACTGEAHKRYTGNGKSVMCINIGSHIGIENPTEAIKDYCQHYLTIDNPEFEKRTQMGFWTGNTPKTLKLYNHRMGILEMPIGCLHTIKAYMKADLTPDFKVIIVDTRKEVFMQSESECEMTPRAYQTHAIDSILSYKNGVVELFAGGGKTNIGIYAAWKTRQKTIWLTHTFDLLEQAESRCHNIFPTLTTSRITEGKMDIQGDIVFCTVQTVHRMLESKMIPTDTFGMVIVDECHRIAISAGTLMMFRECTDYFSAPYKIGLTATLHRADNLEKGILTTLGDPIFQTETDNFTDEFVFKSYGKELCRVKKEEFQVPVHVFAINTPFTITDEMRRNVYRPDSTIDFVKLMNVISEDYTRNAGIATLINELPQDAYCLVLSHRIGQLESIQAAVNTRETFLVQGNTKKGLRKAGLQDVRDGKTHVMFATYQLAREGLDIPILTHLILAMPARDFAVVTQALGRIQRPAAGKEKGVVYDIVDNLVSMMANHYRQRKSIYRKSKYKIEEI